MEGALLAIRGQRSAHSLATGPVIAEPVKKLKIKQERLVERCLKNLITEVYSKKDKSNKYLSSLLLR